MEQIKEIMRRTQAMSNLSQTPSLELKEVTEISIYNDTLTPQCVSIELKKLQAGFPNSSPMFFNLLGERLSANEFTDKRLKDAVGYLLDNFKYPTPSISEIISFDKKIKLYSYSEVLQQLDKGLTFDEFVKFKQVKEKWIYVKKIDKENYNL